MAGTGLQDFWREEVQALFLNLASGHGEGATPESNPLSIPMQEAVSNLKRIAQERFHWTFEVEDGTVDTEQELEEGEDAPVIVDMP